MTLRFAPERIEMWPLERLKPYARNAKTHGAGPGGEDRDWPDSGLWRTINNHLVMDARELGGREASPTARVIDCQSARTIESGGACGYDWAKRIKGRKRHVVTDTLGLMVGLVVHAAGIQDRDGAPVVLNAVLARWPWLRHIFADGSYAGPKLNAALRRLGEQSFECGSEVLMRNAAGKR